MGCPTQVELGNNLVFSVATHDPDTGVLTDADAVPAYRIYEDETAAPILTGNMAKLDDAGTTGFYTELIACTTGNGFEAGKNYTVYIAATVDSDQGGITYGFNVTDIYTKLLKYVQLLARSDAAIETDNATELTAINADGGSGAGDYSAQTDSLEAANGYLVDIDTEVDAILTAVESIAVTGSPLNLIADGRTLTTGTEGATAYTDTYFEDGVYHTITVDTTTIDIEYLFTLPNAQGVPSNIQVAGYLKEGAPAGGDTIALQAYNYTLADWDTIDPAVFTGIITDGPNIIKNHPLLSDHVGTAGGDAQKMRIRFYSTTLEGTTTLNIDHILVGYAEAISTSVAAILADTNELQGDWTDGGRLDLILDAVLADTNELQGDWTNGGRLDLIIDAILADTDELQTNQGNWATAVGFSTHSAADVKTAMEASGADLDLLVNALVNKAIWKESDGQLEMFNDAGVSLGTIAAQITTDGVFTTRKRAKV